jgi:two-component system, LuxR family, response regulator FixJ
VTEQDGVIAVVDDDEAVRRALCRLLKTAGHRVELFDSAEDWLSAGDLERFACLIVDVRLPGLSGLELQRQLRASQFQIPILIITAHADEASRAQALDAGAIGFHFKPLDADRLLEDVSRALGNGYHPE